MRPITTPVPVPVADDDENHVYVSVGHQQMMTDPMKPLGLSVWQLTAARPMHDGRRAAVRRRDPGAGLADDPRRPRRGFGRSDPLIGDALQTIVDRGDFLPTPPDDDPAVPPRAGATRRRSRPTRPSSPT